MIKNSCDWVLMALGFVYWAVAGLPVTVIGTLLYWVLPKQYAQPCGKFIIQQVSKTFISYFKVARLLIIDDADLKKLAQIPGAMIIAPNHLALWDAIFIFAQIPDITCIMKGAILRNPILGGGARLAGYIPNDSTPQMLLSATHAAKKGAKLLIFPEGTRTKSDAEWLNPFKGGIALIAKYSHVPIIPVYIRSDSRFLEKGRPLFLKPAFPIHISIKVGEPITFAKGGNVDAFTQQLEDNYRAELSKPHPLRRKPQTAYY
ncbi:MAG: 1-acyl-sn-glycerol-3-phosphate acyltransferase [Methylococcaceae bacterium]|nr:1-acyl-sn-glycerol-3-phosphate acyltransferase [Methylococcaceae bacterium]